MKVTGGTDGTVVKILTDDGHLRASFSDRAFADAWLAGYNAALADAARVVASTLGDLATYLTRG